MVKDVSNFILIIGAIQGFLFVLFPVLTKKMIAKPIWYLNAVVLFISLNNLQAWLIEKGFSSPLFFVKNMEVPWYLLITPAFYVFLIYYLNLKREVGLFIKLTFVLFSLEIIVRSCLIVYCYAYQLDNHLIKDYTKIEEMVNAFFSIAVFIKATTIVFSANHHKSRVLLDELKWLKQFMVFGLMVILFWVLAVILNFLYEGAYKAYTYYPLRVSSTLLIYWIGYHGLMRYRLMQDRIYLRKELIKNDINVVPTSVKLNFEDDNMIGKFYDIDNYIVENKRYLDPLFSLDDLATETNISSSYASKLINNYSGYSFPDYINRLRVEYAKQLLSDEQYNKYTMVALAIESGFNSKSVFYSAFKKFTGQTPTEFKKLN
ncbi:helix-turn-helix domain-containing protein [Gelatiniphilus marinus]|uniref:Helix-turn-helix domain-containing protein n=1 Tax=Gelatiniphilus marinus TaxID=1759464 RepID=A0ABW5JS28_9FLAO